MLLRPTPWGALLVLRIYIHFFIHLGFPATPQVPAGSEFLDDDISTLTTVLRLSSGESDVLDNHGDYLLFYFRSLVTLTHLLVLVLFGPADIRLINKGSVSAASRSKGLEVLRPNDHAGTCTLYTFL